MKVKQRGTVYWSAIVLFAGVVGLLIALVGREILGDDLGAEPTGPALMDESRWTGLSQVTQRDWDGSADCLLICDDNEDGSVYRSIMGPMLDQMKITYRDVTSGGCSRKDLNGCRTAIICTTDLSRFGEELKNIIDWVENGGHVLFAAVSDSSGSYMEMISGNLGILDIDPDPVEVDGFRLTRPFMIGSDREYFLTDPYESSYRVRLDAECEVFLESADERAIPLVWRKEFGDGTFVVSNLGYMEKDLWGLYASFYSLLDDACAWPVINGSAFFLDAFPGPVSNAEDPKIREDYGINVRKFFTQVWWPDMQTLAQRFGLKYTGSVLEDFSADVTPPFDSAGLDTAAFQNYGQGILRLGGELGLHGYNHMPLVLGAYEDPQLRALYTPWRSTEDMAAGLKELKDFCAQLYPEAALQTYVPPFGILSGEAREMIAARFPEIRVISAAFLPDGVSYAQDFDVAEDGTVNVPRIVSGYQLGDFGSLCVFSELNFHYVNSHYQHPYDVMDAEPGWNSLREAFSGYLDWLYGAAPNLRNMTASEMAGAVQRYDAVTVRRTVNEGQLILELGGFDGEAWFLVRLNGHEAGEVSGGTLQRQAEGLYLLRAEAERVTVDLK